MPKISPFCLLGYPFPPAFSVSLSQFSEISILICSDCFWLKKTPKTLFSLSSYCSLLPCNTWRLLTGIVFAHYDCFHLPLINQPTSKTLLYPKPEDIALDKKTRTWNFFKKSFKTTLVLMLISKNERSQTASNQWTFFFFNLKLTWPYVTILSFDYCDNKVSWLFSYLSGQSFSISFTNLAPLYTKAPNSLPFQ